MIREAIGTGLWATVKFVTRWVWRFLPSILWVTLLLVLVANLGRGLLPWLLLLPLVAAAVSTWIVPSLRRFQPVISDVRRYRTMRATRQAHVRGYRLAVTMGLVKPYDEATERYAMQRPVKRLASTKLVQTPGLTSLWVRQQLPFDDEQLRTLARRSAGLVGAPEQYATIEHPAPGVVRFLWRQAAPVDHLAKPRAGTFRVQDGAPILGRFQDGRDFALDVIGDPYHVAIQGASRSGKSVGVYNLLGGYAPAAARGEVIVCGIDPTGVLLAPFNDYPGQQYRALGLADLDAIPAALTALVAEMDRRIADQLLAAGRDKLEPGDAPALLIVLEEYPGLLAALDSADKALKPAERRLPGVKNAVQRLIQEGAKALIRVQVLAQRADANIIGGAERSNLGTCLSLRVTNADAVRMLHADATPETVEQIRAFPPGYAYLERAGAAAEIVRFDMADYQAYRQHVLAAAGTVSPA